MIFEYETKLDLEKIVLFFEKTTTILGILKTLKQKIGINKFWKLKKLGNESKSSQDVVRTRSPKGHMKSHTKNNFLHINSFGK